MDFSVGPKSSEQDFIVIDEKNAGIWDVINLANKGGIMPLEGRYAISITKSSQKWCKVQLIQYGIAKIKTSQQFFAVKKVKDDGKLKELRASLKASEDSRTKLGLEVNELRMKLANYKVDKKSSLVKGVVEL